ncbi:MAG: hypothetical protein KDN19_10920 [Verrucomicrobiae bacterium]|nr:hypothetical protein [Verrucomicrobiae bacterium]
MIEMARRSPYQILIHVSGLDVEIDGEPIAGFFTMRRVIASDSAEAEEMVRKSLLDEIEKKRWPKSGGADVGGLSDISLEIEQSFKIGWLSWIFGRRASGFLFYEPD